MKTTSCKYKLWVTMFFVLLAQQIALGQEQNLLKEAKKYCMENNYLKAIEIFENLWQKDKKNIQIAYYLGVAHLQSLHKEKALTYLQIVEQQSPIFDTLLPFFLGQACQARTEIEKAEYYFENTLNLLKDKPQNEYYFLEHKISAQTILQQAKKYLQECKNAKKYLQEPTNAQLFNLGKNINTPYAEYAPVVSADESVLVFTSRRKTLEEDRLDIEDKLPYEDIYISYRVNGEWTPAEPMPFNTRTHEASIALSPDGKKLFIYKDSNEGDFYVSERIGERQWTTPKPLRYNINSKYHEPSMSITEDGKTIYFSSDRPGGFGGLDIYKVTQNEHGVWSEPINLGPTINTPYNEDSPFIHKDGKTLYFSSEAHDTMGGFDVFMTEFENGQWTKPQNLGYPINSTLDDIHFVISADFQRGYYATVQPNSFGEKDIYVITMPKYYAEEVETISFQMAAKIMPLSFLPAIANASDKAVFILRSIIKDEITNQVISARMTLYDAEKNEVVEEFNSVVPVGNFFTVVNSGGKYILSIQKEGYLFHSEHFEIPKENRNIEKVITILLKRIKVGAKLDIRVYFDYNKATLKRDAVAALEKLVAFMHINSRTKVEITGYADKSGTPEKNQLLSEERAKTVVNYLIMKGIDRNRLKYRGGGVAKPEPGADVSDAKQRYIDCHVIDMD
ncbi:MAG: OmpA family protein [Microscillaceae bacterium]|nr:OmpA family protein [Microscillaceae bacterium]MDW8460746.1 OmpA family protein [Cytophagales bacterium]